MGMTIAGPTRIKVKHDLHDFIYMDLWVRDGDIYVAPLGTRHPDDDPHAVLQWMKVEPPELTRPVSSASAAGS